MASPEEAAIRADLLPKTKSFILPPGVKPLPPKGLPPSRRESKQAPPTPLRVQISAGPHHDADKITTLRPEGPDGAERTLKPTASFVRRPEPPKPPPGLSKTASAGASPPHSPHGSMNFSRPPGLGDAKGGSFTESKSMGDKTKSKVDVLGSLLRGQSGAGGGPTDSDHEIEVGEDGDNSTDEEEEEPEPEPASNKRHTLVIRPPTMPPPGGGGASSISAGGPPARTQAQQLQQLVQAHNAPTRTGSHQSLLKSAMKQSSAASASASASEAAAVPKAAAITGITTGTVAQMQSKVAAQLGGGSQATSPKSSTATEKPVVQSGLVAQMQGKVGGLLAGGSSSSAASTPAPQTLSPASSSSSGLVAKMQRQMSESSAQQATTTSPTTTSMSSHPSSNGIVAQMSSKVASQISSTGIISTSIRASPVQTTSHYADPMPEPMGMSNPSSPHGSQQQLIQQQTFAQPPVLDAEWVVMWSPEYSRNYWFNRNTGVSTWEDPTISAGGGQAAALMQQQQQQQQMMMQQQQQQQQASYQQQQSAMAFQQQQSRQQQQHSVQLMSDSSSRARGNTGNDDDRDIFGRGGGDSSSRSSGSGRMSMRATFSRMLGGGKSSSSQTREHAAGSGSSKGSGGSGENATPVEIALPVSSNEHITAVASDDYGGHKAKHGIETVAEVQTRSGRHTIVRAKPRKGKKGGAAAGLSPSASQSSHNPGYYAHESQTAAVYVRALYEFVPSDPNNPLELALAPGDVMQVYEQGQDGWWAGTRVSDGRQGLFPAAFVQIAQ